ncbi:MAG TPA: helix-turn-helix domain-containing protein [Polyangiaceae bacterium]|nr:helix-turn-helix domain-containing protein [Polyangiaceae bacterium]
MAKSASPKKKPAPSLRDRLNDETRRVILDAMVEQLIDTGAFEFSMFELARRANISARTIYRHFPTREALFDALSVRVNEQVGFHGYPTSFDAAIELVRKLFPAFDRNAPLIMAQLETRKGREFRSHARKERTQAVVTAVERAAPHVDPALKRHCTAAITCLMSSDAWQRLRLSLNMDGNESGEAIAWAIGALKNQLEIEEKKAKGAKR